METLSMKPVNFEKKAAKNIARVKMLVKAHLSWLYGYPYHLYGHLVWVASDSSFYFDNLIKVDSMTISKAQRTVNTLYKDYPIALPAVVGDADLWYKRCCDYINYAKALIDSNPQTINSLFEQNLKYKASSKIQESGIKQTEVVAQLSWKYFMERKGLKKALKFFNDKNLPDAKIDNQDLINLTALYSLEPTKSKCFIDQALVSLTSNVS